MNAVTEHEDVATTSVRRRVALVTNLLAPYRLPVFERVAAANGIEFCVFFCCGKEPDRAWEVEAGSFAKVFLREKFITFRGRFIHANPDLWIKLREYQPHIVITTGFNPTHMLAFAYARRFGLPHIAMTDGTLASEATLSPLHRQVRQFVFARTHAFIGASDGSHALYRSYGIADERIFKSHLCANNPAFFAGTPAPKRFDFIFCGRFVAVKNPLFAIDVARGVAQRLGRQVSIIFVGSGEMEAQMRVACEKAASEVAATFTGFAQQDELPDYYGAARVFLFPTLWDPWGVVANEACAAGLPIISSPEAGSAGEIVRHGVNGFVLTLNYKAWVDAATRLLSEADLYAAMSARSRELVQPYTFDHAAKGVVDAIEHCHWRDTRDTPSLPASIVAQAEPPATIRRECNKRVVIIQRRMTHYRIPLFELMRRSLAEAGIDLIVVYGDATAEEQKKNDAGTLHWGIYVPCRYWLGGRICWQNAHAETQAADLVVVTQENRLLFNYVMGMLHRPKKIAFWGHGRNFQARDRNSLSEHFKRRVALTPDWWFAYTRMSESVLIGDVGFPRKRITVLNNSIDTCALRRLLNDITDEQLRETRAALALGDGPVGLAISSLHADKKIDFLIAAAHRIRERVADFQLLIVGDGPLRATVEHAVIEADGWIHWLGARTGQDKARLLKLARIVLNPGMVGLGILDAFVSQRPLVTTAYEFHSPEVAYLEHGVNGLMVADDPETYADAVVALLADESLYRRLQQGCARSIESISLETMAARFCGGIIQCLGLQDAAQTELLA
ncbi:glycosyltransferase family 4 protein [Rhodocyclus gracilis]|uniref:glycosyltransferase family 4 protein n=1 Tax=Rhodocyclus gracilis TaxID=2929842 RepID=UPI001885B8C9|nr:glycosyltransferase family 4 protein [Rhodocyclus gracilis]